MRSRRLVPGRSPGSWAVIAHIALVVFVVDLGLGRLGGYLAEGVVGIDGDEVRGPGV